MEAGRLVTLQTPDEFLASTEPLPCAYKDAFGTGLQI